jgi:hypothetical protein
MGGICRFQGGSAPQEELEKWAGSNTEHMGLVGVDNTVDCRVACRISVGEEDCPAPSEVGNRGSGLASEDLAHKVHPQEYSSHCRERKLDYDGARGVVGYDDANERAEVPVDGRSPLRDDVPIRARCQG